MDAGLDRHQVIAIAGGNAGMKNDVGTHDPRAAPTRSFSTR